MQAALTGRSGRYVRQPGGYRAFLPTPLPPDPPVSVDRRLQHLLSAADLALGRLDGSIQILPNPDLFIMMFVRREAVRRHTRTRDWVGRTMVLGHCPRLSNPVLRRGPFGNPGQASVVRETGGRARRRLGQVGARLGVEGGDQGAQAGLGQGCNLPGLGRVAGK